MEGYKIVIKGVDFSSNAIKGGSFGSYITALKKHYTPTSEEERALNKLFGVLSAYHTKFKLLYLFMGDNAESQAINVVDPDKYKLEYINGTFQHTRRGLALSSGQVIDSQYYPTKDELNSFTMLGTASDVSWRSQNNTFIGFRADANANRMGLCRDIQNNGVGLYYVPSSGGSYNSSFVKLSDVRMKNGEWFAATVKLDDSNTKIGSIYSGLRSLPGHTKHQDISVWNINTSKSFNIFCESQNNATADNQGGWNGGYGQVVAFMEYLEESDVVIIGEAFKEFNKSRE